VLYYGKYFKHNVYNNICSFLATLRYINALNNNNNNNDITVDT